MTPTPPTIGSTVRWTGSTRTSRSQRSAGPGVTPPNSPVLERAGGAFYESALGSGGLRYRFRPLGEVREIDDYPAYNFFVRTEALRSVRGWDSRFYGGEDTKLCLALHEAGHRLVYDPDVVVYHHRRPLFAPHMRQVGNVGRHRGYFVRAFPGTSARPIYFAPSLALLGGLAAVAWAASDARRGRTASVLAGLGMAAIVAHARRDGVDPAAGGAASRRAGGGPWRVWVLLPARTDHHPHRVDVMSRPPKVSVVIPTLNSERYLDECLGALLTQDYPRERLEIVIVDAGSTDRTLEIATHHGVDRMLENPLRTGEAGKAVGIRVATGELICLIDSDNVVVGDDWMSRMVAPFDDPQVDLVGGAALGLPPQRWLREPLPGVDRHQRPDVPVGGQLRALVGAQGPMDRLPTRIDALRRLGEGPRWTAITCRRWEPTATSCDAGRSTSSLSRTTCSTSTSCTIS